MARGQYARRAASAFECVCVCVCSRACVCVNRQKNTLPRLLSVLHFQLCDARMTVSTRCARRETNENNEIAHSPLLSPLSCAAKEATAGCRDAEAAVQELTWDGAQVEVVPYDLLELVVQRALLKLQTEVVAQVRVQHFTCKGKGRRRRSVNASRSFSRITVNHGTSNIGHLICDILH